MPNGRPPFYTDPKKLEAKVKDYFDNCPDKRTIYAKDGTVLAIVPELTITGLVLHLGFCDRQSFYDYGKIDKFSCTIKKARTLIEKEYECLLKRGLGAGAIFALKNFGWRDAPKEEDSDERLNEELEFSLPNGDGKERFKRFYN